MIAFHCLHCCRRGWDCGCCGSGFGCIVVVRSLLPLLLPLSSFVADDVVFAVLVVVVLLKAVAKPKGPHRPLSLVKNQQTWLTMVHAG